MPEYKSPGVYIEEIETGAMPIEGVGTSTAGFVGETERGPTEPKLVTSYSEFTRIFGGRAQWSFGDGEPRESYLTYAVDGFFRNGGSRCYIGRIVQEGEGEEAEEAQSALSDQITARAAGPGTWGNNVLVTVTEVPIEQQRAERFNLRARYWYEEIPDDPDNPDADEPDADEVYTNLSIDDQASDYYAKTVNGGSDLIQLTEGATEVPPAGSVMLGEEVAGTDGGEVGVDDFRGHETTVRTPSGEEKIKRTGLRGFEEVDEIAIVLIPDENRGDAAGRRQELLDHCEKTKDRFAIFQAAPQQSPGSLTLPNEIISDPGLGAFYYPWIRVLDPATNIQKLVPPGGHIAGVYARTDNDRGVFKAPANEQLDGVQELEHQLTKEDQDGLNPQNINCLRSFRGRGIRIWGARTTSPKTIWRYVNVRRLFLYLEESIDEGTQWSVFEPNDENLWARVRQSVANFLTGEWRRGALVGTTPEEAFYVKCDRTTMTQTDIDLGRLIVEVGVSPVKPAEFVIFRITQWTGGAEGA